MDRKDRTFDGDCTGRHSLRWCEGSLPVAQVRNQLTGVLEMSVLCGHPVSDLPANIACGVLAEALRLIHNVPVERCPLHR